jgi:hypothetical protein
VGVVGGAASIEYEKGKVIEMKRRILLWIKLSIASLCLLGLKPPVFAQVREAWIAHFGADTGAAVAQSITTDPQGCIYVTGSVLDHLTSYDYTTIKYTPTGQILWIARYNGTGNSTDIAVAVALDRRGDIYVTGSSTGIGTHFDYATVKYDGETGQQVWAARYATPGQVPDNAVALVCDEAGNLYVAGYSGETQGASANADYLTVKYDGQTGQELWAARYNGPGNRVDIANDVAVDLEGNPFVTGFSRGQGTFDDYATIKYDGQIGQPLWVARYNGPNNGSDGANALVVDRRGDVYVAGSSGRSNTLADYATIKYDGRTGQPLWIQRYGGFEPYDTYVATAIVLDDDGNVIVTGTNIGGIVFLAATVKYDGQTGQERWVRTLFFSPLAPEVWPTALATDGEGNVYLTGWLGPSLIYYGNDPWSKDTITVRYDPDGYERWRAIVHGSFAEVLALDAQGSVYVAGGVSVNPTQEASPVIFQTIKYEQAPPGDVNLDFCVDDVDLLRILDTFGQSGDLPEDLNRDGVVDDQDLLTVLFNFGRGCEGE